MAPSLAELPTELLYIICTNFCYHCKSKSHSHSRSLDIWDHREKLQSERLGLSTLRSLCLTNKLLSSVGQPLLYHRLSPFYWDWRDRRRPLLLPFLQTINRVPSLAESTRELDLRYIISVETRDYRLPALLRRLLASTLLADKDCVLDHLAEFNLENLLVQILLCSMPKLETACLGILPGWKFPLMACTGAHHDERHVLLYLKTLSLTGPAVNSNLPVFGGIDKLLASAPNLRNLRLQELTYCPPSHLLRQVRRLEVCHVPMSSASLRDMLRECTQLEEFHYTGMSFDAGVTDRGAFGIEMIESLAPARDTLRCLDISYANHTPCIKNTHPDIASLKHFTKLQRINLSTGFGAVATPKQHQYFTFGMQSFADILPDSVQVFCPPCWPDTILALAASVQRKEFPNLKRVELEHGLWNFGALSRSSAWRRKKATLKDAFVDIGVDVSFVEDRDVSTLSQWHTDDE